MAKVILQTLQASDSQKTYSDKANYNFHLLADYINGVKTIKGDKGNVGMPGATGRQGIQGERGNSLFVYGDEEKGQKFPSPDEKTYEDLKKKYVSWCEENGITNGDLVLFMDKEAIYKSGVNNEEKVPDIKKDLVVDLSKIISDFVDEKTKTSEFWKRIDQDRDIITLKQYLDIDSKKSREDAKIVLAPDMINNDDVSGYVANKLAEAPLNIYSHIGSNNVNDIYSYQSGISLNSIYVLNGNYSVEDKDREFRITQRSIRKDKSNTDEIDYVEGLFVVAPQTSSSNRDGMTSGFRFISKAEKDSDLDSNTKKNNIVTIGDGKFTNGMLMNGYGGENVENAITFARGNAEPVTDSQFGGFFSIGTEYDKDISGNYKIKGFIRTESIVGENVEVKTGELVVGGYDTFLTFSYDTDGNKIYTKNQNIKIYSVDGSIERGLYINNDNNDNNDKSILLTNKNEALCNIKLDTQITQEVKKGDNTAKTEVFHQGIKNNVTASNGTITNVVNNNAKSIISTNRIENYITDSFVISQRTARIHNTRNVYDFTLNITTHTLSSGGSPATETKNTPLHITAGFNPLKPFDESEDTHDNQRYTVWVPSSGLYERLDEENHSYWINTYNKKLTITNVYGGDVLNLVYPLIPVENYKSGSALIQFKTYDATIETPKIQWIGGIYLIPSGTLTEQRYTLNNTNKVSVYKNYGIQIQSSTELVLKANKVNVDATSIEIGDANSVVTIAGIPTKGNRIATRTALYLKQIYRGYSTIIANNIEVEVLKYDLNRDTDLKNTDYLMIPDIFESDSYFFDEHDLLRSYHFSTGGDNHRVTADVIISLKFPKNINLLGRKDITINDIALYFPGSTCSYSYKDGSATINATINVGNNQIIMQYKLYQPIFGYGSGTCSVKVNNRYIKKVTPSKCICYSNVETII